MTNISASTARAQRRESLLNFVSLEQWATLDAEERQQTHHETRLSGGPQMEQGVLVPTGPFRSPAAAPRRCRAGAFRRCAAGILRPVFGLAPGQRLEGPGIALRGASTVP